MTAYITHGVLSGGAVARVTSSKLKELVITNSIEPTAAITAATNIRAISIAPLDRGGDQPDRTGKVGLQPVQLTRRHSEKKPALPAFFVSAFCPLKANAKQ